MKRIKLRALDKETMEIRDVMGYSHIDNAVDLCNVPVKEFKDGVLHTIHALSRDMEDVILLQYVRHKDISDIELYEGDVVKGRSESGSDVIGYISWNDYNLTYDVIDNQVFYGYQLSNLSHVEKLGNIYENSDLSDVT